MKYRVVRVLSGKYRIQAGVEGVVDSMWFFMPKHSYRRLGSALRACHLLNAEDSIVQVISA